MAYDLERARVGEEELDKETFQKLWEVAAEAQRIMTEANLKGDHYTYDLMRTILSPLEEEV